MGRATPFITISLSSSCSSDLPVNRRAFSDLITLPWTVVPLRATTIPFAIRLDSSVAENIWPVGVLLVSRVSNMRTRRVLPAKTVALVGFGGGADGGGGGGAGNAANLTLSTSVSEYVFAWPPAPKNVT